MLAAAMVTAGASAQTVEESKTFDNFYLGVHAGVSAPAKNYSVLNNLNWTAGLRLGRNFTPVFGMAVDLDAFLDNAPLRNTGTTFRGMNLNLLGTVNLSNWFGGYKGEPRAFEVTTIGGLGWTHVFDNDNVIARSYNNNDLNAKFGFDFALNLGAAKAWQVYVEPAINWDLTGENSNGYLVDAENTEFNVNRAYLSLQAGLIYKFGNSNGTHNFKIAQLRDQSEIDGLNQQISDLRNELAKKPKEIVKEVNAAPQEVKVENLVFVTFAQGKSNLTKEAKSALDVIKSGKHVQIVGTASPEGSKEINDKISQGRADNVAEYLKSKGVTVDEATGKGVQGTTSNRIAVVYVK